MIHQLYFDERLCMSNMHCNIWTTGDHCVSITEITEIHFGFPVDCGTNFIEYRRSFIYFH